MRNAISTFGSRPNPNQTRNSGATATFGMACDETRSGSTERENAGHTKMASASGTPSAMLSKKPSTISTVVVQPCLRMRAALSANDTTIWLGEGSRKAGTLKTRVPNSQATSVAITVIAG